MTRVLSRPREIVDNHAVEHTRLGVLAVDIEVHVRNLVVEGTLRDFNLGRFLTDGEHQGPHLCLRHRQDVVLKEKSADSDKYHENGERLHYTKKGDAGCLHGGKLEILAEIAEGHKRRQKDC